MKTPSPTPAQAVVLEALTDAEYVLSLIDETFASVPQIKAHHERMRKIAARLAALVQPPEAPAAVEVSRLAEAGERVLEEWNRLFPATVYVSSQQTAWEDFEFRQMSELRAALKQGKQS